MLKVYFWRSVCFILATAIRIQHWGYHRLGHGKTHKAISLLDFYNWFNPNQKQGSIDNLFLEKNLGTFTRE